MTYTGSGIRPAQVTYSDNWQDGRDLTISYSNNTNVGAATVSTSKGEALASVNFTIDPKTVGLIWSGHTGLVYDGTPKNVTAAATGVASSDTCAVTVSNGTQTNAGTYTAEAVGLSNPNYRLPNDAKQDYTIAKATGTAAVTMEGWTYDGTAKNEPVPSSQTNGITNVTYHYTSTGGYNSAAIPTGAGSYTVTATFAATENYNAVTAAADFTIAKATPDPVTPTGLTATYGDKLSDVGLPGGWSWEHADNPVGDAGTRTHTATFTPDDAANYNTVTRDLSVAVAQKTLIPAVGSVNDKIYDGTRDAAGTITLTGAVLGDQPTASGTFTFDDTNVGTDKEVTVAVTLDDGWNSNYVLSQTTLTATADITPATVGLAWHGDTGLIYDGASKNVTAVIDNLVTGDDCTLTYQDNAKINAGNYKAEVTALDNGNYTLAGGQNLRHDWRIDPAVISFTVGNNSHTYCSTLLL